MKILYTMVIDVESKWGDERSKEEVEKKIRTYIEECITAGYYEGDPNLRSIEVDLFPISIKD